MGEEQKVEEPKAEEMKLPEENGKDNTPAEEKKDEEPKPPPAPFVLYIDLHCVGCAKKIERSLLRIPGVIGMDIDMEKNQVTIKGVVEPQAVCDKITKKTKRIAKVLSPAAGDQAIPKIVTSEAPESITVELNVNMHCEACALQLKRKILRMKGVRTVETEVGSSKVTVTGSMDGEKLVEYVYRRTRKQAKIVPQPEPESKPEPEPTEKPKEEEKAEEKPAEEAKAEEKPTEEEKKEGGDDGKEEEEKLGENKMELMDNMQMQRMMYYHQYPPMYVMERIPPPQLFSEENPNACSIS